MSKVWHCAVLGTGLAGEWHVRSLPRLPNARLVAVCDVNRASAEAMLRKCESDAATPIYDSLDQLLSREKLDVLHVCTPSGAHQRVISQALEAGVNVISEKPLEIRLDRIDQMSALAEQRKRKVACIYQNRYDEPNRLLHRAVREGRFGRITWAGSFTPWFRPQKYYAGGGWRGTWEFDGGGAIMNQSIHSIDLLQWIVGPVRRVSAYAGRRAHDSIEVEDTLSGALEFENGAMGTIVGSTAMYPGAPARIEVSGENGSAVSEEGLRKFAFREEREQDKAALAEFAPAGQLTSARSIERKVLLHQRNIESILSAWEQGREADTCAEEARKAVAIVLAMYESARRNGDAVPVESSASSRNSGAEH